MSKQTKQSKGGQARSAALTKQQKSEIARMGAIAKHAKVPKATHRGNFQKEFGFDVECYVLDDEHKTAVISQRGMGAAIGLSKGSGGRLHDFLSGNRVAPFVGRELTEKLANPLVFNAGAAVANLPQPLAHGYDVTILIDICKTIVAASAAKALQKRHDKLVAQAHVILGASGKAGIKNLVYALAGYDATREEVIAAFKAYVLQEARGYEKEFPEQLYEEWHRLYGLPKLDRNRPWKFKALTLQHVYTPLARSNGKILKLTRDSRVESGERHKRLHQFLSEIGVKALRTHLGQILGIALTSTDRAQYEAHIRRIFDVQLSLDIPS